MPTMVDGRIVFDNTANITGTVRSGGLIKYYSHNVGEVKHVIILPVKWVKGEDSSWNFDPTAVAVPEIDVVQTHYIGYYRDNFKVGNFVCEKYEQHNNDAECPWCSLVDSGRFIADREPKRYYTGYAKHNVFVPVMYSERQSIDTSNLSMDDWKFAVMTMPLDRLNQAFAQYSEYIEKTPEQAAKLGANRETVAALMSRTGPSSIIFSWKHPELPVYSVTVNDNFTDNAQFRAALHKAFMAELAVYNGDKHEDMETMYTAFRKYCIANIYRHGGYESAVQKLHSQFVEKQFYPVGSPYYGDEQPTKSTTTSTPIDSVDLVSKLTNFGSGSPSKEETPVSNAEQSIEIDLDDALSSITGGVDSAFDDLDIDLG